MIRYCPQCGAQNPEAARYCGRCGAPLLTARPRRPPMLLYGVLLFLITVGGLAAGYGLTTYVLIPHFFPATPTPFQRLRVEEIPSPMPSPSSGAPSREEGQEETPQAALTHSPVPSPQPSPALVPIPSPTQLAPPPRLAFVAGDPGRTDIYIAEADGTGIRCLVCQPSDDAEPDWDPNGRIVVYQSNRAGSYDLWIVDAGTGISTPLLLTPEFDEREPDWSPDGRSVLFQRLPRGAMVNQNGELCILTLPSTVECLGIRGRGPAWRPDGQGFAFMAEEGGVWQIFYYESGRIYQISFCPNGCRWPAWSPDGTALAYNELVSRTDFRPVAIYSTLMGAEVNYRLVATGDHPGRPSWSISGWIAMNTDRGIEVVRPDGTGRRVLIPRDLFGVDIWAPSWSQ